VVSIYVLNKGSNGGSFRVASSGNVYNFLRETRPDVLRTLSQPFVFDTYVHLFITIRLIITLADC
jgi:hypothetical protein